ncbi:hypothetical protein LshimejAT787_0111800 [Lyophyllum shimeji]|uniref:Uncharacterized protein n=1 Tax=Lyophyllum shimeji TaxID=47721 RepID=A0A9P3PEA9_LYOSH|nr:hypothetical protein LshimejAT787_0111800 [Lyophyllum shimeji]
MGELGPQLVTFVQFHISSERWERFSFYANRVRHLECTDQSPEIHHQSYATLSITRPMLHLLPNLTHLTWKKDPARPAASLVPCLLFLTPGLRTLSVETGHSSDQGDLFAIDNFFRDVVYRSPRIEHLEFRSDVPFHGVGPSLSNFLIGLRGLKTVLLSDALLTSDVVTALAKCPMLESIRMSDALESAEGQEETDDLQNYMPVMESGAFPNLKEMEIKAHLWNVVSFLQSEFPAARLQRLVVRTLSLEDNASIGAFFARVAQACPAIQVLSLSVQYGGVEEEFESLPFAYLEPLLHCTSLTTFTLNMPLPLDIDDAEAAQMASSWPRMRDLHLNPFPAVQRPAGKHLTFGAMASFAMHCPDLQALGVYMQSSFIPPPASRRMLPKLQSLILGLIGTGYSVEDLALFLTDITPSKCSITGHSYIFLTDTIGLQAHIHVAESKLKKIFSLLPMLRSIHAQYQERIRTLEAEVRKLSSVGPGVQS